MRNLENGELERCFRMDVEARSRRAGGCSESRSCFRLPLLLTAALTCPAQVFNDKGEMLVGSHYILKDKYSTDKRLPCVVICHGNAGCRVDANGPALALLSRGITCFCFDFSGCGVPPLSAARLQKDPNNPHRPRLFSQPS